MKTPNLTRNITGLIIIIIGLLAFSGSVGGINFDELMGNIWPSLVIAGGILLYFGNRRRSIVWPLPIVIAGVLFQIRQLDLVQFDVWQLLWPLAIVGAGVTILLNRSPVGKRTDKTDGNSVVSNVILSGSDLKISSQDFQGGDLMAILGGVSLDLTDAKIKKTATIHVFCLMGGIDISVPRNWRVQSNVTPIMGGVDGKALKNANTDGPVLIITGDVALGGVEIKN